ASVQSMVPAIVVACDGTAGTVTPAITVPDGVSATLTGACVDGDFTATIAVSPVAGTNVNYSGITCTGATISVNGANFPVATCP
ncbi:hypothetical protein KJ761_01205, partial [Patescibacteria group bacterium]|nr:hypothetical protein [Patescibacteria group bacterium]